MRRAILLLALAALLPQPAGAQSLFNTRGLGTPSEPLDARARALGGIGVGLLGVNPSLVNPAELGGLVRRGVSAALQPTAHSQSVGDEQADVSASRFPLIGILYPINRRIALGVGYGGYLEQGWGISQRSTQAIDGRQVEVHDVVQSTGGIGQVRLSAAYLVTPALSLGLMGGVLTGNLDRLASRAFNDTTLTLRNYATSVRWEYGGLFGGAGVRYDVNPGLRVGASFMVTGDIDADSVAGTAAPRSYGGAMQITAGASGRVTRDLLLALGAARQRFPQLAEGDHEGRETWTAGASIEYEGLRGGRRVYPVRLGARWQQLPYYGTGEEPAKELTGAFGVGFRLAGDESGPLAVVDVGVERAQRTGLDSSALAGGVEDSMWRFTFSLALFGR